MDSGIRTEIKYHIALFYKFLKNSLRIHFQFEKKWR